MKKLMIMAVAGLLIVSCGSKKETKSVEEQTQDYAARLDSVAATGDSAAVVSLSQEIEQWQSSLSQEDQRKVASLPVFTQLVKKAQTATSGNVKQLIDDAVSAAAGVSADAASAATDAANTATDAANAATDVATNAANAVNDAANSVANEAKTQAKEVKDAAKQKANAAVNNAQQKTNKAIDNAASKASSKANEAIKNAGNDAKKALGI